MTQRCIVAYTYRLYKKDPILKISIDEIITIPAVKICHIFVSPQSVFYIAGQLVKLKEKKKNLCVYGECQLYRAFTQGCRRQFSKRQIWFNLILYFLKPNFVKGKIFAKQLIRVRHSLRSR
jgi:hypothetical protein